MSKKVYIGDSNNIARLCSKGYIGVSESYIVLSYLECSGSQWISSGVHAYQTKTEMKIQLVSTSYTTSGYFAGSWHDNNNRYYVAQAYYSGGTRKFRTGDKSNNYTDLQSSVDTNEHIVIYNDENNKVYWDGIEKATISDLDTTSTNTIGLFCRDGGADILKNGRIYYCKITDKSTNTLVRNFVPVRRVSDNVLGLYDRVEGKFYKNKGTGNFTGGTPTGEAFVVPENKIIRKGYIGDSNNIARQFFEDLPYIPENYIESTGTQYINTNYKPNTNTKVVLKFILTGTGTLTDYERILESYSGSTAYLGLKRRGTAESWSYQINNVGKKDFSMSQLTEYTLELDNTYLKVNDDTYTFTGTTYTSNYPIHIFRGNDRYGKLKLYYLKIYENNVLVKDFIPVLDLNNVPCLYDNISHTFFYNAGSGTFLYG